MPNKPTKQAATAYFNMRDNGETRLSGDVPVFIATEFRDELLFGRWNFCFP